MARQNDDENEIFGGVLFYIELFYLNICVMCFSWRLVNSQQWLGGIGVESIASCAFEAADWLAVWNQSDRSWRLISFSERADVNVPRIGNWQKKTRVSVKLEESFRISDSKRKKWSRYDKFLLLKQEIVPRPINLQANKNGNHKSKNPLYSLYKRKKMKKHFGNPMFTRCPTIKT